VLEEDWASKIEEQKGILPRRSRHWMTKIRKKEK
jgi:hypothetical protein